MMSQAKVIESDDLSGARTFRTTAVDKYEAAWNHFRRGARPYYAVLDNGSNNLVTLRYRLKDVAVKRE